MKNVIICFFFLAALMSCKSDKKNNGEVNTPNNAEVVEKETEKKPTFQDKLSDVRTVNKQFTDDYKVQEFGTLKVNDSIFGLVFKLDETTTPETVEKYSIGMNGFTSDSEKPFKASFAPVMTTKDNNNYIVLSRNTKGIKYFDSIDVYIYARKNWKKSGRLGTIRLRDVLLDK